MEKHYDKDLTTFKGLGRLKNAFKLALRFQNMMEGDDKMIK